MKNNILNYEYEELDEFIVPDYFSKKIGVYDIVQQYVGDHLEVYRIMDNDKLERIAYELYGNTEYWDLLLMINDRNPLFEMPLDTDFLQKATDTKLNTYLYYTYSQAPLTDTNRVQELSEQFHEEGEIRNDKYRYIYVVKPQRMSEFIKILKDNGYL